MNLGPYQILDDINGPGAKFAFVQLILADRSRTSAVGLMEQLEGEKAEKVYAQEQLQKFKDKLEASRPPSRGEVMSAEDIRWCNEKGIDIPGRWPGDYGVQFDEAGWTTIVENTEKYIEGMPDNSQSLMVLIQDALGQYNAYTQGASSNVSSANSIMQGLARW